MINTYILIVNINCCQFFVVKVRWPSKNSNSNSNVVLQSLKTGLTVPLHRGLTISATQTMDSSLSCLSCSCCAQVSRIVTAWPSGGRNTVVYMFSRTLK